MWYIFICIHSGVCVQLHAHRSPYVPGEHVAAACTPWVSLCVWVGGLCLHTYGHLVTMCLCMCIGGLAFKFPLHPPTHTYTPWLLQGSCQADRPLAVGVGSATERKKLRKWEWEENKWQNVKRQLGGGGWWGRPNGVEWMLQWMHTHRAGWLLCLLAEVMFRLKKNKECSLLLAGSDGIRRSVLTFYLKWCLFIGII